tara:strand:- start:1299 stop:2069 length:771 start_codon:yes stop_codon:yes gene_type:complete
MAKQTINIGTDPNDGTGDLIRNAFDKCNDNFTELYTDDAGDVGSITATAPIERDSATGAVTISLADAGVTFAKMQNVAANSLLIRNANSSGVLTELALATTQIMIGDGTGMVSAALSGDVTMNNAGAVTIANDAVSHAKLEDRYTKKTTNSTTTSQTLQADDFTSFILTGNIGTATLTIDDMKTGQVIDIHMTGTLSSAVITLAFNFSSTTINKIGTGAFDQSEKNLIQIACIDDTDGAAIVNYSVGKITADSNPD